MFATTIFCKTAYNERILTKIFRILLKNIEFGKCQPLVLHLWEWMIANFKTLFVKNFKKTKNFLQNNLKIFFFEFFKNFFFHFSLIELQKLFSHCLFYYEGRLCLSSSFFVQIFYHNAQKKRHSLENIFVFS